MAKRHLLATGVSLLLLGLLLWGGPSRGVAAHGAADLVPGGTYRCPMAGYGYGYSYSPWAMGPGAAGFGYGPRMGTMGMMGMMPMMGSMGVPGYNPGPAAPPMGRGMMNGMAMMAGMMGGMPMAGMSANAAGLTRPITARQAVQAAQSLPLIWGDPDLAIAKVLEFTNHFYVLVTEKGTGTGALELLVDRYSGLVKPSPTTVWNARYGQARMGYGPAGPGMAGRSQQQSHNMGMGPGGMMMGRMGGQMMGGQPQSPAQPQPEPQTPAAPQMTITPEQARQLAQEALLEQQLPGTSLGQIVAFPGYYTIIIERNGQVFSLLSINGYSGQVWLQSWHGGFIAERSLP